MIVRGQDVWITDVSARRIVVVDDRGRAAEVPLSIVGHDLAMRPASDELWVTPWNSNRAVIINPETRQEIAAFQVGREPAHKHLAFTEDGREAWITEPSSGSLFVVDAQTRELVTTLNLGGHPHHLRFAAGRAYIAVGPDTLVQLDVRQRHIIGRVTVGSEVHDVGIQFPAKR